MLSRLPTAARGDSQHVTVIAQPLVTQPEFVNNKVCCFCLQGQNSVLALTKNLQILFRLQSEAAAQQRQGKPQYSEYFSDFPSRIVVGMFSHACRLALAVGSGSFRGNSLYPGIRHYILSGLSSYFTSEDLQVEEPDEFIKVL